MILSRVFNDLLCITEKFTSVLSILLTKTKVICSFRKVMNRVAVKFFLKILVLTLVFIQTGLQQKCLAYEPPQTSTRKICNSLLINAELEANQEVLKNTLLKLFMVDYPIFFQPQVTRILFRAMIYYLEPGLYYDYYRGIKPITYPSRVYSDYKVENFIKYQTVIGADLKSYLEIITLKTKQNILLNNNKDLKSELNTAAEVVWNEIVSMNSNASPYQHTKKFSVIKPEKTVEMQTLVLVINKNLKLKTAMLQAIIEFFFMSSHYFEYINDVGINSVCKGFAPYFDCDDQSKQNEGREKLLKNLGPIHLNVFKNKPTLIDIEIFKDENMNELLLDSANAEEMNFESFLKKLGKLSVFHAELNSSVKISELVQELRILVHALNLMVQGNFERFQTNVLWPKLKLSTMEMLKSIKNVSTTIKINARHELMRTNVQAISYVGSQIVLNHKILEVLFEIQAELERQDLRLHEVELNSKNEKIKMIQLQTKEKGIQEFQYLSQGVRDLEKLNLKRTEYLEVWLKRCQDLERNLQNPSYIETVKESSNEVKYIINPEKIYFELNHFLNEIRYILH